MVVRFNFIGQSKLTTFGEGRIPRKKGDDEYVSMDFQGKGGVGKTKLKLPSVKQDMAIGAGLGAGTAYLLRKRARDIDDRSDKGKKRKL